MGELVWVFVKVAVSLLICVGVAKLKKHSKFKSRIHIFFEAIIRKTPL